MHCSGDELSERDLSIVYNGEFSLELLNGCLMFVVSVGHCGYSQGRGNMPVGLRVHGRVVTGRGDVDGLSARSPAESVLGAPATRCVQLIVVLVRVSLASMGEVWWGEGAGWTEVVVAENKDAREGCLRRDVRPERSIIVPDREHPSFSRYNPLYRLYKLLKYTVIVICHLRFVLLILRFQDRHLFHVLLPVAPSFAVDRSELLQCTGR